MSAPPGDQATISTPRAMPGSSVPGIVCAVSVSGKELGIEGKFTVRDLWRQKDLGTFTGAFESVVPYHGVLLVKITPQ